MTVSDFPSQVTSATVAELMFHLAAGCDLRSSFTATLFDTCAACGHNENGSDKESAGERQAEGKRLMYKDPLAEREYIENREQEKGGEQLEPF